MNVIHQINSKYGIGRESDVESNEPDQAAEYVSDAILLKDPTKTYSEQELAMARDSV